VKIALVSPYSWTTPGGVNVHIAALARHLRVRGHEVRVIAPADIPAEPGVTTVGRTIGVPFNGSIARLAFGPRVFARVRIALRRARPDLVHIHEPFAPSVSLLALIAAKVPVVATFHAAMDSKVYRASRLPLLPLWRKIDAPIAVSRAARATVEPVFGLDPVLIPNGVECATYADVPPPDPDAKTILYFGRLERRKGPHVLIRAAPEVLRSVPGSRLVLAGDGPLRAELEAGVPSDLRSRVSFRPRFEDAERAGILTAASVVCLPAIGGESFGIALAEAMAAGRPVVASDIAGFAEVAGAAAVLVEPGDAVALASALRSILTDREAIRRLAIAGRQRAATFDWPAVTDRIEAVYRGVVGS
jgi:phosphatidylinositol alpha-mannosyltransferase